MKVPFLDLKEQYQGIKSEVEPKISEVLESCNYIGGKYVRSFEEEMEGYLGVRNVLGCSNGTDALMLGLRACNIKPGDEVITTAFSFFATAEAIAAIGAKPVFADIKADDYTIDPDSIEKAITSKTKAILPVHIFGAMCDMDRIMSIAKDHGLKVIEDCAQAIGSEYKGKKAGTIGDVGCFSFYPTKNLGGAGDGGMVTSNRDDIATVLRAFKEHGAGKNGAEALSILGDVIETPDLEEEETELYDPYKYYNYLIGYNSRLDAIQAVYLSAKLKHIDTYNEKRSRIAEKYLKGLTDRVIFPHYKDDYRSCWHQFVIRTDYKMELCRFLSENGVGNGTFYPVPLHKQKAFNMGNSVNSDACLEVAERICSQTVCLPIFPELTEKQTDYVIETVNRFFEDK